MKMNQFFVALIIMISLFGCSKKPQLKAIQVALALVESSVTTTSTGTVIADQQAVLGFGTSGRVAQIFVKAGDTVKKGKLLAELDNRELKAIFDEGVRELKRAQELFRAGLLSKAGLDQASKNHEVARANLERTLIHAPFDGVITEMNLQVGELSQTSANVISKAPMRIVDLQPRLIQGDIDEIDLSKVRIGIPARIRVPAVGSSWFSSEVRRVVPFVSTAKEQDRTSEIELKITDPDKALIPVGASAEIEIITEKKDQALAVPTRVVLGKIGERHVFRFQQGKLEKVAIKTGIGNYERTEIVSGLKQGDEVVFPPEDFELRDGLDAKVELQPWP